MFVNQQNLILDVKTNGNNVVEKVGKVLLVAWQEIVPKLMNGIINVEMVLEHVVNLGQLNVEMNGNNVEENTGQVLPVVNLVIHVNTRMNGIHNV